MFAFKKTGLVTCCVSHRHILHRRIRITSVHLHISDPHISDFHILHFLISADRRISDLHIVSWHLHQIFISYIFISADRHISDLHIFIYFRVCITFTHLHISDLCILIFTFRSSYFETTSYLHIFECSSRNHISSSKFHDSMFTA